MKFKKLKKDVIVKSGKNVPTMDQGVVGEFEYPLYGANGIIGSYPFFNIKESKIIVGRVGSAGEVNIAKERSWISDNALVLDNKKDLLMFLYYSLKSTSSNLGQLVDRNANPLLSGGKLKNVLIPDVSLAVQQKIVEFLDKKTFLINKKISLLEKKIELYEEYKKSTIKKTIENVKGDIFRLKQRATISTGSQNTEDRDDNGQYPFYVRSQTVEKSNKYDFDELCILTPGDGDVGRIFHIFDGKCGVHQRVYCIRKFKQLDSEYLVLYLKNYFFDHVMRLNQSTTVNSLRLPMFLNFVVKAPEIEEQKEIAKKLSLNISKIDKLIELTKKEIELQKEYKKTLINDVVTGKIEV